jgi:hypothetical protein
VGRDRWSVDDKHHARHSALDDRPLAAVMANCVAQAFAYPTQLSCTINTALAPGVSQEWTVTSVMPGPTIRNGRTTPGAGSGPIPPVNATGSTMDAFSLMNDQTKIVFMADQQAFESKGNAFCVLQPLMTFDGDEVEPDAEEFPNRGRVWWMIKRSTADAVTPGSLWSGELRESPGFDPGKQDADQFQVKGDTLKQGAGCVEVLSVNVADPYRDFYLEGETFHSVRQPCSSVFLSGYQRTIGPLLSIWDADSQQVSFRPRSPTRTEAVVVSTDDFNKLTKTKLFRRTLNESDMNASRVDVTIVLAREHWIKYEQLREAGEVVDLATDEEVMNWALNFCKLNRADRQQLRAVFNQLPLDSLGEDDANYTKLLRIEEISKTTDRLFALGEDVARDVSQLGGFKDLIEKHVDSIAEPRIVARIQAEQARIEAETADSRQELTRVKDDLAESARACHQEIRNERARSGR